VPGGVWGLGIRRFSEISDAAAHSTLAFPGKFHGNSANQRYVALFSEFSEFSVREIGKRSKSGVVIMYDFAYLQER